MVKKKIKKIALTGGPCACKTSALSWIRSEFTKLGYAVIFVPETATTLLSNDVNPIRASMIDFERAICRLQVETENVVERYAQSMRNDKVLIVCDRGVADIHAYLNDDEFEIVCHENGLTKSSAFDRYDAVFHLVTAANGAIFAYSNETNAVRRESPEEAIEKDKQTLASWLGHPHLRVIGNETDFEGKMKKLMAEIKVVLGEPEPCEIERKFLIEKPSVEWLEENGSKSEIEQIYLLAGTYEERRIRKRTIGDGAMYTETIKMPNDGIKRIEKERRISAMEYEELKAFADPNLAPVLKTRYCLVYNNQYFEIDLYPIWDQYAIMEIELRDENQTVDVPDAIHVVREISGEQEFANRTIAAKLKNKE